MSPLSQEFTLSGQHPLALLVLFCAGTMASGVNAVAGGGSLLSFPLLIAFGVPPLSANATNSVALWPGSLASAFGYWDELARMKKQLPYLIPPTVIGSLAGAYLLTHTPERIFDFVVPILVLAATTLLALQKRIRQKALKGNAKIPLWAGMLLQLFISVYGGYFGAGIGIVMLALFGLFVEGTLHEHNALKSWLAVAVNVIASLFFLREGLLWLIPGFAIMAGAITGGYISARVSKRIDPDRLRAVVIAIGTFLTLWFFWSAFGRAATSP